MKLKFINQQYQTDAVNSICDIFEGSEVKDSLFTIDITTVEEGIKEWSKRYIFLNSQINTLEEEYKKANMKAKKLEINDKIYDFKQELNDLLEQVKGA